MKKASIQQFENDAVQEKKLDGYNVNQDNFVAGQEITVQITLNEYRDLVASKAIADDKIKKSNDEMYEVRKERDAALAEAERLKAENYDLQARIMAMQGEAETVARKPWEEEPVGNE